jgi:hypothetical protein
MRSALLKVVRNRAFKPDSSGGVVCAGALQRRLKSHHLKAGDIFG